MRSQTEVLIVGAGPVGLMAANLLAHNSISFRIIDNDCGPIVESRALVMHVRTLELLDKLNITSKAIAEGIPVTKAVVMLQDKEVLEYAIQTDSLSSPYPYTLGYDQSQTERLLIEELEQQQHLVEWQTEFVCLTQYEDRIEVVVRGAAGEEETISCQWVLGADGSRSGVRHALGIVYKGRTYNETLFQIDALLETPPVQRDAITIIQMPDLTGVVMPLPGEENRYRLFAFPTPEIQVKIDTGRVKEITLEELQRWCDRSFCSGIKLLSVRWSSAYLSHCRLAEHFRSGRCFLLGDAAHAHGPGGGQGMNLGIGDAYNLVWKLALVIKGQASEALLESYEAERRPIMTKFLRSIKISHLLEDRTHPMTRFFGHHVLPLMLRTVLRLPAVRSVYMSTITQLWIQYRQSPIVKNGHYQRQDKARPQAGDRAPFAPFTTQPGNLYEQLRGIGHHLLLFEGPQPQAHFAEWQAQLERLLARYQLPLTLHCISAQNHQLNAVYHVEQPSLVLVRPDGYIGYIGPIDQLPEFTIFMNRWFSPQEACALVA